MLIVSFRSFGHIPPKAQRHANSGIWKKDHHMDSPIISRLFRQLFTHRACQKSLPSRIVNVRRTQSRSYSAPRRATRNENDWARRSDIYPQDMDEEFKKYPMVTSDQLRTRRERPRKVKMLTRDFIEGWSQFSISHPQHNYSQNS